jgi:hypothetical protein
VIAKRLANRDAVFLKRQDAKIFDNQWCDLAGRDLQTDFRRAVTDDLLGCQRFTRIGDIQ